MSNNGAPVRPATIAIQIICTTLGLAAIWSAFALSSQVLFGGLVVGSFLLMAAALLGSDHTSKPGASKRSRQFFKYLAVLATLPIIVLGLFGAVQSAVRGQWGEAIAYLLKLVLLALVLVVLANDTHPSVQRLLRRKGLSARES